MPEPLFKVEGFKELQQKIKRLGDDRSKKKEVLKLLRQQAKATVKVARQEAPKGDGKAGKYQRKFRYRTKQGRIPYVPGQGAKSIRPQVMRRSRIPMLIVGPRSFGKFDGFYMRQFVIPGHNIYGTGFRRNRKGNRAANARGAKGKVAANPFMQRAFQRTRGQVTRQTKASVERYLQRQIDRL